MLTSQIISPDFPTISCTETVADLHTVLQSYGHPAVPLLCDELVKGIISAADIQSLAPETLLGQIPVKILSTPGNTHFLTAMKVMMLTKMAILPVVNENGIYIGTITRASLLQALGIFMAIEESEGAIISLQMTKTAYSFTELARLIESNDANITQLNTYLDNASDRFIVTIRIDKKEVSDIISTLQRYEYHVVYFWGDEMYQNELKRNYDALMNYLSI